MESMDEIKMRDWVGWSGVGVGVPEERPGVLVRLESGWSVGT